MNTPNPLHPQGAFSDQRGRAHVRIAVFTILAVHVVLLGALLLQGCKRTTEEPEGNPDLTGALPPFEPTSNVFVPPPDIATFAPSAEPSNPPSPAPVVPASPPTSPTTPPPVPTGLTPPGTTTFAPPPESVAPPTPPTPPTPVTPSAPPAANREHTVVKNDSFYSLGKKYGVSMKAIAEANPGVDSRRLMIGQKLIIPPPPPKLPAAAVDSTALESVAGRIYKVRSGDTLTRIARKHGTTVKALRRENNLRTDRLLVGQKLKIPAKKPKPSAASVPPLPPGNP